ncbi:uncharacterized protein LOC111623220 [Centruroides sculpturatus]|uniref:uncharacterized protein LOC111623220 n=1 Tax=Centruroides sculpturatus TaxID=218467 RepID=UPI000C6E62AE|nr:uncharacterized protein LOC111623220 [Centruroides sculpturatus]
MLQSQTLLFENGSDFDKEMVEAFTSADIPLEKLKKEKLRLFLEKYMKKPIKSVSALRAHQKTIFNPVTEKFKDEINGHDIYFIVDETSDKVQHKVVNVLVGKLNGKKAKSMF